MDRFLHLTCVPQEGIVLRRQGGVSLPADSAPSIGPSRVRSVRPFAPHVVPLLARGGVRPIVSKPVSAPTILGAWRGTGIEIKRRAHPGPAGLARTL